MKFILALLASLIIVPAFADDAPRKIDLAKVLTGIDGTAKDCRRQDEATGRCIDYVELTLGRICVAAAALPDKNMSLADQIMHGRLANKLADVMARPGLQQVELSPDDITFLKAQIAKLGYNAMAVYQAIRMLDPTVDK